MTDAPSPIALNIVPDDLNTSPAVRSSRNPLSWYNLGYFSDLLYLIVVMAIGFGFDQMEPFQRPIDKLVLTDPDLSHPHLANIVSSTMLWVYAIAIPIAVGILYFGISWSLGHLKTYDATFSLHLYLLALLLAVAITGMVTNILKIWGGRFRPDFLDRCKFNETLGACTGEAELVRDGRRSWPSGHASLSFAGLGFLGLWFFGLILDGSYIVNDQMTVKRRWAHLQNRPGRAWRFVLPFAPWLLATYVAVSRTQQYIHHPSDVLTGAIIGFVVAVAIYFGYFRRNEIRRFNGYQAVNIS